MAIFTANAYFYTYSHDTSTWNPLAGCTRVTAGCDHCFAFTLHDQRHTIYQRHDGRWSPGGSPMPAQYARSFSEIQLLPERLMQPLRETKPKMIAREFDERFVP
jgi:protein gp37